MSTETPITFECGGDRLTGIIHEGSTSARAGIVVVVGGPQYRVGSHRQFVLMARGFSGAGIPVFRFDCRGMGDAAGDFDSFERLGPDIRAAIDCFLESRQGLSTVILLGLCDAASAIAMYCGEDKRVSELILMNPWARTEHGEAKAYLKHYYWKRVFQKSFWTKLLGGRLEIRQSIKTLLKTIAAGRSADTRAHGETAAGASSFLERMLSGIRSFQGRILLIMSGHDLTAREFEDLARLDSGWRAALDRESVSVLEIPTADHTLSRRGDLNRTIEEIVKWVGSIR